MPNKEVYTDTHFDANLIMDEQSVKELVEKCISDKSIMSKKFTNDDRYIQNISQTIYLVCIGHTNLSPLTKVSKASDFSFK